MRYLAAMLPLLIASSVANAQPTKTLIDSENYVFQPRTAQPLRGPIHNLGSYIYTLKITKDRIVSDLPYYGRAYVAPMDPTKGTLQFTTKKFSYTLKPGKKEGWTVVIKPEDNQDIEELQLDIGSDGYASLQVLVLNSDPISFNGIIIAPDKH